MWGLSTAGNSGRTTNRDIAVKLNVHNKWHTKRPLCIKNGRSRASLGILVFILRLAQGNSQRLQRGTSTFSPVSQFTLCLLAHELAPEVLVLYLTCDKPSNAVSDVPRFAVANRHQKTSIVALSGISDIHPAPFRPAAGLGVVAQVSVPRHQRRFRWQCLRVWSHMMGPLHCVCLFLFFVSTVKSASSIRLELGARTRQNLAKNYLLKQHRTLSSALRNYNPML